MLQTDYESKVEFYCTGCAEKDQRIKALEEQIQGMVGDQIDLLAKANKELALYKKALELSCEDIIINDGEGYDYKTSQVKPDSLKRQINYFLQQAKEEIKE